MKNRIAKTLGSILLVMAIAAAPSPVRATDYILDDPGYITNTQIEVDGVWYDRPGLESFPATETLGSFNVRADFGEGSPIVSVQLFYGFFGFGDFTPIEMEIGEGTLTAQIPAISYPEEPHCIPGWGFGVYLLGFDSHGNLVEIDERHYEGGGGGDPYTIFIILPHVDPIIDQINAPIAPVPVGTTVETSAPFTDPDNDAWIAQWFWGDGTDSEGTVEDLVAYGTHTYDTPGVYTVELLVSDDEFCGTGFADYQYVVVYDPDGGFVTGGGWIWSPLGAYTPIPTLSGKATFGFVSKYQRGANVPTGSTEFQFHAAGMNFKSTAYDWLVIAGSKAQFKGIGTINGAGEYKFMLTAIDGSPDKFRIKIWDAVSGEVIYDNMLGAGDTDDPTTVIQGGSIVIHK
jgi:hypothetical protein